MRGLGFARRTRRGFGFCSFSSCGLRSGFCAAAAVGFLVVVDIEACALEDDTCPQAHLTGSIHRLAFGADNLRLLVHAMELFKQATAIRAFVIIRWHKGNIQKKNIASSNRERHS